MIYTEQKQENLGDKYWMWQALDARNVAVNKREKKISVLMGLTFELERDVT